VSRRLRKVSETSSGDSETASLVMSGPENLTFMAPLHHMRVGLSLEQLQRTHAVYSAVIHDRISAAEGARQLKAIMNHRETYRVYIKILFAFLAGFAICPMGFSGSFVDGLVAGASSAFLMIVQLLRGGDILFTGIFECADYSIGFLYKLHSLGHITGSLWRYLCHSLLEC